MVFSIRCKGKLPILMGRKRGQIYLGNKEFGELNKSVPFFVHVTDHGQPDVRPNPHHHVRDVERNQNVKGAKPDVHPDY